MTQNGVVIRGEMFKLAFAPEASYGQDPGTSAFSRIFGVVQTATMPDPQVTFNPIYALGTASKRNWYVAYKGLMTLSGAVPDIWLLNGRPLYFPLGACVDSGAPGAYTHTITETITLPSLALHVTYNNSAGSIAWMRRFYGGKVGRATISGSEGDYLKMSIDEILFNNFAHNLVGEPFYSAAVEDISPTYPTTQPYLFSYGSLKLNGVEFARIKSFSLSITNGLEVKNYITNQAITQLPYEHREQRREYQLSVTVDIEDEALYKEVIRQGVYTSVFKGFQVIITFTRGTGDAIILTMPTNTPAAGGDAMGCLISQGQHNIVTDAVVSVPLQIIGRNLGIVVEDAIAVYP